MISAALLQPILPFLETRGADSRAILRNAGLRFDQLSDPLAQIAWEKAARLLEVAARDCRDSLLGLRCGLSIRPKPRNILDHFLRAMPSVEAALEARAEYARLLKTGHEVQFIRTKNEFRWTWNFISTCFRVQLGDYLIATHVGFVQSLTSIQDRPILVEFDHPPLGSLTEYRSALPVDFTFNGRAQAVTWSADILSCPLPKADLDLVSALEPVIKNIAAMISTRDDFVGRVKNAIRSRMTESQLSAAAVAADVGCSARTMQRKLRLNQTTYRDVVELAKKEAAGHLVTSTDLPITEISYCLGYSEVSAFSRQFKTWFGLSPRNTRTNWKKSRVPL